MFRFIIWPGCVLFLPVIRYLAIFIILVVAWLFLYSKRAWNSILLLLQTIYRMWKSWKSVKQKYCWLIMLEPFITGLMIQWEKKKWKLFYDTQNAFINNGIWFGKSEKSDLDQNVNGKTLAMTLIGGQRT